MQEIYLSIFIVTNSVQKVLRTNIDLLNLNLSILYQGANNTGKR